MMSSSWSWSMGGISRHFVSQLSIFQVELKYLSTVRRIHRNEYSTSTSLHQHARAKSNRRDSRSPARTRANLGPAGPTMTDIGVLSHGDDDEDDGEIHPLIISKPSPTKDDDVDDDDDQQERPPKIRNNKLQEQQQLHPQHHHNEACNILHRINLIPRRRHCLWC